MKSIIKDLVDETLRNMFALLRALVKTKNTESFANYSGLIILLVQEMELQGLQRKKGQPVAPEDAELVAYEMHQLQQHRMGYGLMLMSMQIGYLLATHPEEMDAIRLTLEKAVQERNKDNLQ